MSTTMPNTVIHYVDSDTYGGCEEVVLTLLAGIDRSRWCPVLLHHDVPGIDRLVNGLNEIGISCRAVPPPGSGHRLAAWRGLVREIRKANPAVFHGHLNWPLGCRFGLAAAKYCGVPAILATSHLFAPVAGARYGAIKQRIQSAIVDRYLAVSREVAQRLCSDLGIARSKVRVVHNGIQTAKFDVVPDIGLRRSLTDGRDRPIVLVPARLHSQKGHVYLLQAAALVPGVVFALAGDGPERSALESLAHQLHIEDRVRFLGQRCDMPQLYAACDLVVLPSLYEGLPLTPLEAMASAKPVIATAVGGTDEAVVNGVTGLLVPPKSIAPLAAAINELLTRRELAAALGNEGRRRVLSRFSIESMVQGVVANYDEFLGRAAVALRTH